jgi:hypothetical protein
LHACDDAAETNMKIYLLILLIGMILTAVRLTSAPEQQPESIQQ